jgi:hypothetical protein
MPWQEVGELATLPGPFEILELPPGGQITLRPVRWSHGKAVINPRDGRPPREIPVLRMHVPPADKKTLPGYWDITSGHLIAGLLGDLEERTRQRAAGSGPGPDATEYVITKTGSGASARFTLETRPRR